MQLLCERSKAQPKAEGISVAPKLAMDTPKSPMPQQQDVLTQVWASNHSLQGAWESLDPGCMLRKQTP